MKKTLIFINLLISSTLFIGCSARNANAPKVEAKYALLVGHTNLEEQKNMSSTEFTNIEGSETLINVKRRSKFIGLTNRQRVHPTIIDIKKEVLKRGYRYFQIVSPVAFSNLEGFPINNEADFYNFLDPHYGMPRNGKTYWGGPSLMDNNEQGKVIPRKFFNDKIRFECVIRLVANPEVDEIVWDAIAK